MGPTTEADVHDITQDDHNAANDHDVELAEMQDSLLGQGACKAGGEPDIVSKSPVSQTMSDNELSLEDEDDSATHRCGYLGWEPDWLQKFHTPQALLACVCLFAFIQGFVVNGIINVNLATLERRFNLSSAQVAWVSSIYDVTGCMLAMIFGYVGIFVHKGRVLSIGCLVMAVGSFVMFLPHALSGTYQLGVVQQEHCIPSDGEEEDEIVSSGLMSLLLIGQLLHSVGGSSLHTLATSYMDENINIKSTSTYVGIYQSSSILGPALAYCLGGQLLNVYVDVGRVDIEVLGLTPHDPRWVGAWWIGFVFSSSAALLAAALMACFGRELPAARKNKHRRRSQAHGGGDDQEEEVKGGLADCSVSHALASFRVIICNPVWAMVSVAVTLQAGLLAAFGSFLPKIVQFQFSQPPATAALMVGMLSLPGAVGGQLLGGLLPKWLKLEMRGLLRLCAACSAVSVFTVLSFLLRCQMAPIVGVTVPYQPPSSPSVLTDTHAVAAASLHSPVQEGAVHTDPPLPPDDHDAEKAPVVFSIDVPCNANCSCSRRRYNPVCGVDGLQYFSPCHAGCTQTSSVGGKTVYSNCGCVSSHFTDTSNSTINEVTTATHPGEWDVEHGVCSTDCRYLAGFLIMLFFTMMAIFMVQPLAQTATIRCVPDAQRPLGVGIQQAFLRLFGGIPGPVLLGTLFDRACLVWQGIEGESQGSCWMYDSGFMATGMTMTLIIISTMKTLCYVGALLMYKPPQTDTALSVSVVERKDERT